MIEKIVEELTKACEKIKFDYCELATVFDLEPRERMKKLIEWTAKSDIIINEEQKAIVELDNIPVIINFPTETRIDLTVTAYRSIELNKIQIKPEISLEKAMDKAWEARRKFYKSSPLIQNDSDKELDKYTFENNIDKTAELIIKRVIPKNSIETLEQMIL